MRKMRGRPDSSRSGKPNDSWSAAALRDWIEKHTAAVNRAIESYMARRSLGGINTTADKNILKLQRATGQKKIGLTQRVASLARKRKSELIKQAEALSKFEISEKRSQNWTQKTTRKKKKEDPFGLKTKEDRFGLKETLSRTEPEPEPESQPFEGDEKRRRAYETFNRNYGGEEGISPELYQRFVDTIGGVNFENYNVESNYVVQNIIEYLEQKVPVKKILDAWDFAFRTEQAGETTYDKVVRANMFINDEVVEMDDGMWMNKDTGEVFYYW